MSLRLIGDELYFDGQFVGALADGVEGTSLGGCLTDYLDEAEDRHINGVPEAAPDEDEIKGTVLKDAKNALRGIAKQGIIREAAALAVLEGI